ncbi:hypothetical protein F4776DRAFT_126414 [Hypoxylon sp. NC0597]|nr:hypothetical protein F4776DRAFT_126414 [Hypoxylon sp. NC0597]
MNGVESSSPYCEMSVRCDGNIDSFRLERSLCRFAVETVRESQARSSSHLLQTKPDESGTESGTEASETISAWVFRLLRSSLLMHTPSLDQRHSMSGFGKDLSGFGEDSSGFKMDSSGFGMGSSDSRQLIRQPHSVDSTSLSTTTESETSDKDHVDTEAKDVKNSENAIQNPRQHRGDYVVIRGNGVNYNGAHRQNRQNRQNHHDNENCHETYRENCHVNYRENYREIGVAVNSIVINHGRNSSLSEHILLIGVASLCGFAFGALLF